MKKEKWINMIKFLNVIQRRILLIYDIIFFHFVRKLRYLNFKEKKLNVSLILIWNKFIIHALKFIISLFFFFLIIYFCYVKNHS